MLTQQQVDFYHENGYLGINGVYSEPEMDELRRITDGFVELSRSVTDHTDVFDLEPGHSPEEPRLRRLKDPIVQHEVYARAIRHEKLLDIVEQLIGSGIHTNGNKLNMKSAGYGSAVEWHQDWAFYPHTNDDLLAVGIALDDMKLENGPLLVIPGSHKGKIYSHHHEDGYFVGGVTEDVPNADKAVPIELEAGGISIHHVRTLHASAPNTSSRPRRLLLFQFCAFDAWPLIGVKDWSSFTANFLRGEPTKEPRMTAIPFRVPLPNPERVGSIYEMQTQMAQTVMADTENTDEPLIAEAV
ncbi:phytanoyl-CoA dioxygenase family protein [Chloroflexi bacterium TSY]|nr:phytanoyl-CoA dioxygenase family protein [Chloroflexi bacterium TSY]